MWIVNKNYIAPALLMLLYSFVFGHYKKSIFYNLVGLVLRKSTDHTKNLSDSIPVHNNITKSKTIELNVDGLTEMCIRKQSAVLGQIYDYIKFTSIKSQVKFSVFDLNSHTIDTDSDFMIEIILLFDTDSQISNTQSEFAIWIKTSSL